MFFYAAYNNRKKQVTVRTGIHFGNMSEEFLETAKEFGIERHGICKEVITLPLDMDDQHESMEHLPLLIDRMKQNLEMMATGLEKMSEGKFHFDNKNPLKVYGFGGNGHKNADILKVLQEETMPHQKMINDIVIKAIGLENVLEPEEIKGSLEIMGKAMENNHKEPIAKESTATTIEKYKNERNALIKKIIEDKDTDSYKAIQGTLSIPERKLIEAKLGLKKA